LQQLHCVELLKTIDGDQRRNRHSICYNVLRRLATVLCPAWMAQLDGHDEPGMVRGFLCAFLLNGSSIVGISWGVGKQQLTSMHMDSGCRQEGPQLDDLEYPSGS
jgi:hypothetical protein